MVIQNPDRRVRSEDPECNVDSLVWLLVTDMAVRGVPLALGRFRFPVIQGLDDQEDEFANNGRLNETGRLQMEEDEIMSAGPSSRETRQWREVAAMQRRFHVLRSSALNADEGDIDYQPSVNNWRFREHPMTILQRQRPPLRWWTDIISQFKVSALEPV